MSRSNYSDDCGPLWEVSDEDGQGRGAKADALERLLAKAQLEMYYSLIKLPEKSHEGACGPESGCDAACMDIAHFDEYVSRLWKIIGKERRPAHEIGILAELRRAVEGATGVDGKGKSNA